MPKVSASERAATRARLVEAAKTEFALRGLAGARFDEISLAAGCAKGTIYNYFDSKEALFFSIVEEWCRALSSGLDSVVGCGARDQLLAAAELDVEIARKDPDLARVVVLQIPALMGSHADAVQQAIAPGIERLERIFERALAADELTSDHGPSALARLFLAVLSAIETEALLPSAAIELDDVVELVDRHFLAGLDPR